MAIFHCYVSSPEGMFMTEDAEKGLSENVVPLHPNGFADHYPY